jgi:ribosomal protein S18 acetylase RimI-like enzyme
MREVWKQITAERIHSAVVTAWRKEQQRSCIGSLSAREVIHLAEEDGQVIGFQSLDLWSAILDSMAHVGQVGAFVLPHAPGCGVGRALWGRTREFAIAAGYRKIVIYVRASNAAAQALYRSLGFAECGRLGGQVIINGVEDDEILMERFLSD